MTQHKAGKQRLRQSRQVHQRLHKFSKENIFCRAFVRAKVPTLSQKRKNPVPLFESRTFLCVFHFSFFLSPVVRQTRPKVLVLLRPYQLHTSRRHEMSGGSLIFTSNFLKIHQYTDQFFCANKKDVLLLLISIRSIRAAFISKLLLYYMYRRRYYYM